MLSLWLVSASWCLWTVQGVFGSTQIHYEWSSDEYSDINIDHQRNAVPIPSLVVFGTTAIECAVTGDQPWPTPQGFPRASLKEARISGHETTATFITSDPTTFILPKPTLDASSSWIVDMKYATYGAGQGHAIVFNTPVLSITTARGSYFTTTTTETMTEIKTLVSTSTAYPPPRFVDRYRTVTVSSPATTVIQTSITSQDPTVITSTETVITSLATTKSSPPPQIVTSVETVLSTLFETHTVAVTLPAVTSTKTITAYKTPEVEVSPSTAGITTPMTVTLSWTDTITETQTETKIETVPTTRVEVDEHTVTLDPATVTESFTVTSTTFVTDYIHPMIPTAEPSPTPIAFLPSWTPSACEIIRSWDSIEVLASPKHPTDLDVEYPYAVELTILDAGFRSEKYTVIADGVTLGTTSNFQPSTDRSDHCGWMPSNASKCLENGFSTGTFTIPSNSRSVVVFTAFTSRYTGQSDQSSTVLYQITSPCDDIGENLSGDEDLLSGGAYS